MNRPASPDPGPSEAARREVEHHLAELTDRLIQEGLDPDEARREAERRFGDVARYRSELERGMREDARVSALRGWVEGLLRDARFGVRTLAKRPGLTASVVLTLGVGIGVNLSVFGIVDAILLDPLPVEEPDRLVSVYRVLGPEHPHGGMSYPDFVDVDGAVSGLSSLAGSATTQVGLRVGDRTERVGAAAVTGDYFATLGVRPRAGRLLVEDDARMPSGEAVAVVSDRLWSRAWDRVPGVVGGAVEVGGRSFTVVGVAPPGFTGTRLADPVDLWIPLPRIGDVVPESSIYAGHQTWDNRDFPWLYPVGRLSTGADRSRAEAEMEAAWTRIREAVGEPPEDAEGSDAAGLSLVPVVESSVTGGRERLVELLFLLGLGVSATLVLACVSVASLLLARATRRSREMAIRRSIGASRGRLVRQLFTESGLLAALGAGAGLLVALGTDALVSTFTLPGGVALAELELGLDGRVLLLACLLAGGSALLSGLAPALSGSVRDATPGPGRTSTGRTGSALRTLLSAQVALSLVLLVGATLFARSVRQGLAMDTGLEPEGVAGLSFGLSAHGYTSREAAGWADRLLDRLERSPEVEAAAVALHVPLAPNAFSFALSPVEGPEREERPRIPVNVVGGDYFGLMGIELVEGRLLEATDRADTEKVVVLSEGAVRSLWPDGRAVGRELVIIPGLPPIRVVGVVEDVFAHGVAGGPEPYAYFPVSQQPGLGFAGEATALVRARAGVDGTALLRREIRAMDASLSLFDPRRVTDQIREVLAPQRLAARLVGLLALVALLVSALGIHGAVAYAVGSRRREIGIRMALGAVPRRIVTAVAGREGAAIAVGLGAGLLVAWQASGLTRGLLFGVDPVDPASYLAAVGLLAGVGLLAAAAPVWRALTVDPRETLRED